MPSELIMGDLFCGAGGLSTGFQCAGYRPVFANDIDEDCQTTYRHNHRATVFLPGSIEAISAKLIYKATGLHSGDIDVLVGGPPCQGFSINAPKREEKDKRNHLFHEYARLVLEGLRPKVILMENVPGMLSLDDGQFVDAIYKAFGKAGYQMAHMVLCAAHYGVPQERWRLVFIGTRLDRKITFPVPTRWGELRPNFTGGRNLTWFKAFSNGSRHLFDDAKFQPFTTVRDAIGDLPPLQVNSGEEVMPYASKAQSDYQIILRQNSRNLFNHVAGALSKQNLERIRYIPVGGSWRDIPFRLLPAGMKLARRSDHTRRYGRIDPDGISGTIMTKCDPHWGSFFHYDQDRTLTVREAARLQSFPDTFRFLGSRVSQYMQVGNAVPPMLAQIIAEHIKERFF